MEGTASTTPTTSDAGASDDGAIRPFNMIAQPQAVTDVILEAVAASTSGRPTATVGGANARED
jgi:hypothetical protein